VESGLSFFWVWGATTNTELSIIKDHYSYIILSKPLFGNGSGISDYVVTLSFYDDGECI
jgi:hypothetical protein